jgi:hypothetical protein
MASFIRRPMRILLQTTIPHCGRLEHRQIFIAPHSVALKNAKASDTLMPLIELQRVLRPSRQLRLSLSTHPYMSGKILVTERQAAVVIR